MRRITKKSRIYLLVLACAAFLTACAAPPSALLLAPLGSASLALEEYAIVEQSTDNPNHAQFQDRVPGAVSARRAGWHLPGPEDQLASPNQALAPFGFRLEINPSPPFGAFALYRGSELLRRDIARFWPVSVKNSGAEFLLPFETLSGERLLASGAGVHNWPGSDKAGTTPPVYYGDSVVYAAVDGPVVNIYSGSEILYGGLGAGGASPRNLHTWGSDHWALELDGRVIMDGEDLNKANRYDEIFLWQIVNDEPLYFFERGGLAYINYAGRDLPYSYDSILHDQTGEASIYNPGTNGSITWFYALRDGLWYYVELGRGE